MKTESNTFYFVPVDAPVAECGHRAWAIVDRYVLAKTVGTIEYRDANPIFRRGYFLTRLDTTGRFYGYDELREIAKFLKRLNSEADDDATES